MLNRYSNDRKPGARTAVRVRSLRWYLRFMPVKRPATLQDVADLAGVSRGAASFALTDRTGVSAATRERVRAAAAELGYRPNPTARNLRAARTGIIVVYLPSIATTLGYYTEAAFGMVDEALEAGLLVTLLPRPASGRPLPRIDADGVIAIDPVAGDPVLEQLLAPGLPVVSGEAMPAEYRAVDGEVRSDHAAAARELLDHFAEHGARAPAIIVPEMFSGWSDEISQAYRDWCAERGVRERIETVSVEGLTDSTIAATRKLLGDADPADAIISLTEGSVLNVITSATEYGRTVGADLLVAAAVDSPALRYTEPSVTAIDLHPRAFGRECMRVMREVLDGRSPGERPRRRDVPIDVVFRDSTRGRGGSGSRA